MPVNKNIQRLIDETTHTIREKKNQTIPKDVQCQIDKATHIKGNEYWAVIEVDLANEKIFRDSFFGPYWMDIPKKECADSLEGSNPSTQ